MAQLTTRQRRQLGFPLFFFSLGRQVVPCWPAGSRTLHFFFARPRLPLQREKRLFTVCRFRRDKLDRNGGKWGWRRHRFLRTRNISRERRSTRTRTSRGLRPRPAYAATWPLAGQAVSSPAGNAKWQITNKIRYDDKPFVAAAEQMLSAECNAGVPDLTWTASPDKRRQRTALCRTPVHRQSIIISRLGLGR